METRIYAEAELQAVLRRITFANSALDLKWKFEWAEYYLDPKGPLPSTASVAKYGWLLWVTFERPDTITGDVGIGRGREEIIWLGTPLSGVVKTAWLLIDLVVRHELMEGFRFDNARIFNPHNSVLDLAKLQDLHEGRLS